MAEVETRIDVTANSVYGQLGKLTESKYVKQEPYVDDDGIYVPVNDYVPDYMQSTYRCVMTKEMFVEAYDKYINKPKRRYKGGWSRRKR